MGSFCYSNHNKNQNESQYELDLSYGYTTKGVTECYMYHDRHLEQNEIKLSIYDKTMREMTHPLYLMQIEDYFAIINDL